MARSLAEALGGYTHLLMDIVLRTNDENYLGFRQVQRYSDRSGFGASLVVRTHGFCAELLFAAESEPFVAFIEALEEMDRSLTGKARLEAVFEDPYIELELDHTGKVRVSGDLVAYGSPTQRLQFEFMTDQTALGPFARDLRSCISLAAT